jgi:hypothetical protein
VTVHRVEIACARCVRTKDLFGLRLEEIQPRVTADLPLT